jgi:hypothetical protein
LPSVAELPTFDAKTLLTTMQRVRHDAWLAFMNEQIDEHGITPDCFVADIEQNVGWSTCGPVMPVTTRRGMMWNYSLPTPRWATSYECLLSNGHPIAAGPGIGIGGLRSPSSFGIERLTDLAVNQLNGNGVSLPAFGAWIVYCMSNVARIDRECSLPTIPITIGDWDSDTD